MDGLIEKVVDPLVWKPSPMPSGWAPPENLIDTNGPRPEIVVTTLTTHTDAATVQR